MRIEEELIDAFPIDSADIAHSPLSVLKLARQLGAGSSLVRYSGTAYGFQTETFQYRS